MPQVIKIKATVQETAKISVAAYARVSSSSDDQMNSFSSQVKYYTELIKSNGDWNFVDMYADAGLTGTRADIRPELQRLLHDCRQGLIDKVLIKSISRLSRNTNDCLKITRELKELGIGVVFEKEAIDTAKATEEMMLVVLGALAQQESLSISQNLQWAIHRRMKSGEYVASLAPYGYRREGDALVIIEDEAAVVRQIFSLYLEGKSPRYISKFLLQNSVPSPNGKKWPLTTIKNILTNEKYKGDTLHQKRYTPNELPFKKCINYGYKKKYYVKQTHEPIIDSETFDKATNLFKTKQMQFATPQEQEKHVFNKIAYCEKCHSKVISKSQNNRVILICNNHYENKTNCPVMPVHETDIHRAFLMLFNKLLHNRELLIKPLIASLDLAIQRSLATSADCAELNLKIAELLNQSHALSRLHTQKYLDSSTYHERSNKIETELTALRASLAKKRKPQILNNALKETKQLNRLLKSSQPLLEFDEDIFKKVVKRLTIDNEHVYFEIKSGLKLCERIKDDE